MWSACIMERARGALGVRLGGLGGVLGPASFSQPFPNLAAARCLAPRGIGSGEQP